MAEILCVSRDVTSQRVMEQRLLLASEYDELTGLPNRRLFKKKLKQEMKRALHGNKSLGLMLLDLDHFKLVNDTLGHAAGDHLLRILGKRLSACMNAHSFVSRLGGDEFAVVISDVENEQDIFRIANKFLLQLETPITHGGKTLHCGMSLGGAIYPKDARDASELMKCADTALYELKDGGRGGVYMFDRKMMDKARARASQLNYARQIVRDNCIRPSYQPKVCLTDGSIVGFEALLRWHCPINGVQLPATVSEAFNDYELATKISEAMQLKVFADIARWRAAGVAVRPISLNVSPIEFLRDNYAETFLQRLLKFHIPHPLIELEVTEHAFNKHGSKYVLRALQMLKEMGIRIALDDFGTGHSSFSHIMDYPLDCIKLDCDFVQRMNTEPAIRRSWKASASSAKNCRSISSPRAWKPSCSGKRCAKPVSISAGLFVQPGCGIPAGARAAAGDTTTSQRRHDEPLNQASHIHIRGFAPIFPTVFSPLPQRDICENPHKA
ncbi:diguanylate cyclase [Serratia ureilytica]